MVAHADEVWLHREKNMDGSYTMYKRYVKYYHNEPVILRYPKNNTKSWTIHTANTGSSGTFDNLRKDIRKGVLIFRK